MAAEEAFAAVCNARVVRGAEAYYRNMFFRFGIPLMLVCRLSLTGLWQEHMSQGSVTLICSTCALDLRGGMDAVCPCHCLAHSDSAAAYSVVNRKASLLGGSWPRRPATWDS